VGTEEIRRELHAEISQTERRLLFWMHQESVLPTGVHLDTARAVRLDHEEQLMDFKIALALFHA